jgi:hypothetical protein
VTVTNSNLRTQLYTEVLSLLNSGGLTASDLHNSSVTPSIGGFWSGKREELPRVVVKNINVASVKTPRFNEGFDTQVEAYSEIRIFSTVNKHLDQLSDQIMSLFRTQRIVGVELVDWAEDYDLVTPNDNMVYGKTLMLTFIK